MSRDIATFNKFCSRMGSIVKTTGLPLRNQNSTINQQHCTYITSNDDYTCY